MIAPENLPLPELTDDSQDEIVEARADALVTLYDELNSCWFTCFPDHLKLTPALQVPSPENFFKPFLRYGVALYEAYADALLKLQPEFSDYETWMNFALKTKICEELAPSRPVETWGKAHLLPPSEWQMHMATTWHHFDHRHHSALSSRAQMLFNALEDPRDFHWERFRNSLHKAISRRTRPLLTVAFKVLRGSGKIKSPPKPTGLNQKPETNLRPVVDAFLQTCNDELDLKLKLIRTHIWRGVGHQTARQFQYWQAQSDKSTDEDDRNFRRILAMTPKEFAALLRKKGIIS